MTEPIDPFPFGRPVPTQPEQPATAEWTQIPGRPQGIEIHRDGKTMRNTAPPPPA